MSSHQFSALQRAYDNTEEPAELPAYLETDEGQQWLSDAVQGLMDGKDQTWKTGTILSRRTHGVSVDDLENELAGTFEADELHQCVHLIATGAKPMGQTFELCCSAYKEAARKAAERLLTEHADARADYDAELARTFEADFI